MSEKTYTEIAEALRESATPGEWRRGGGLGENYDQSWKDWDIQIDPSPGQSRFVANRLSKPNASHIAFMHNIEVEVLKHEAALEGLRSALMDHREEWDWHRVRNAIDVLWERRRALDARARELVGEAGE